MPDPTPQQRWTIHICEDCGRVEGEQPQAGCCPGCGFRTQAIPNEVAPLSELQEVERERDRLKDEVQRLRSAAPGLEPCGACGGRGVVDENGNPSVWGRTDSRECAECDGRGSYPAAAARRRR